MKFVVRGSLNVTRFHNVVGRKKPVVCRDCGKNGNVKKYIVDKKSVFLCEDCADNNYHVCEDCSRLYTDEDSLSQIGETYVCDSCYEENDNYQECYECGKGFDTNSDEAFQDCYNNWYCSIDCIEKSNCYCEDCDSWNSCDISIWVESVYKSVCESCLICDYSRCDHCEEYYLNEDVRTDDFNNCICDGCYENCYYTCESCGMLIHMDNTYESERGSFYCEDCYEDYRKENCKIHEYSYKPEPCFNKCSDEMTAGLRYFGVELEVDEGGDDNDNAKELLDVVNSYPEENVYCKHDSSIDNGFEIVTHPMTLKYHLGKMDWDNLCRTAVSMGYRSHDTSTCGLHVHVNRNSLGGSYEEQEFTIANILFLVDKFWEKVKKFSRRKEDRLNHWCGKLSEENNRFRDAKEAYSKSKKDRSRYKAVNLLNSETIEFRVFRGTLNSNTIIATLQFVNRICDIAHNFSCDEIGNVTWKYFVDGIKEKELLEYLDKRGILNTDKDEEEEPQDFIIENGVLKKYVGSDTNVTIPDGVTEIGDSAFYNCILLTEITIPDSVTEISNSAFSYCESLKQVTIPDGVTEIGDYAFRGCTSLQEIIIPDGVTEIGYNSFHGCISLQKITIPDSVTCIGGDAFRGCSSLQEITIPNSVTCIGGGAFCECTSLKQVTIPDGVTCISGSAFKKCTSLEKITIPDSVTKIGHYAFSYCTSLQTITIPNNIIKIGINAFLNCISLKQVIIPNSVTEISYCAFCDCTSLTKITIPNSVTKIGIDAFRYCTSLEQITIPDSVTCIEHDAFCGCSSLQEITIPNSVTCIGDRAFGGCTSLTEVTIPDSVTKIGHYAFSYCESLKQVTIPDGVTEIGDYAFYNCILLKEATMPNSVTEIGDSAFCGCTSLQEITIPNSVTEIGGCAFYGCVSLKKVTIPDGVTEIGYSAFDNCPILQKSINN